MTTTAFHDQLISVQASLLSFAYTLTNNRDDAYDLLQDTTMKALTNCGKYADDTNFKGWMFTIMRNIFINNYRRTVRTAALIDNSGDPVRLNVSDDSVVISPEGSFSVNQINEAIEAFDPKFRMPFSMHVAGYRYAEIAVHMNLPVGTVKSRIFTARQKLREMFAEYA